MRFLRPCLLVTILVLSLAAGCDDQEPPLAFNTDLGNPDSDVRLLPTSLAYYRARDASITAGNQRATLIKLDEYDPNAVPEGASGDGSEGQSVDLSGAEGAGDAMEKVGKAFLNNLMGKQGESGEAGEVADTTQSGDNAEGTSNSNTQVAEADQKEIRDVLERYNTARTQRLYADLAVLSTEETRASATRYYALVGELNASFGVLLNSFEKQQAGARQTYEQELSAAITVLNPIEMQAPDADIARVVTNDVVDSVVFRRESGAWYLVDPFVPGDASWPDVESKLTEAIDALDDKDDALASGGTVPASEIEAVLDRAVALLAGEVAKQ